jgi:hypothetical protein
MRSLIVAMVILATPQLALGGDSENWLIGPVIGLRLGGGFGGVFGVEGGYGLGPERINLGFEHRADKMFYYVEADPWYLVGGTLGIGVEEDGRIRPVLGVWEGIPLNFNGDCNGGWHTQLTLAVGYRYTGVHELYATVKAGRMNGDFCIDE